MCSMVCSGGVVYLQQDVTVPLQQLCARPSVPHMPPCPSNALAQSQHGVQQSRRSRRQHSPGRSCRPVISVGTVGSTAAGPYSSAASILASVQRGAARASPRLTQHESARLRLVQPGIAEADRARPARGRLKPLPYYLQLAGQSLRGSCCPLPILPHRQRAPKVAGPGGPS